MIKYPYFKMSYTGAREKAGWQAGVPFSGVPTGGGGGVIKSHPTPPHPTPPTRGRCFKAYSRVGSSRRGDLSSATLLSKVKLYPLIRTRPIRNFDTRGLEMPNIEIVENRNASAGIKNRTKNYLSVSPPSRYSINVPQVGVA